MFYFAHRRIILAFFLAIASSLFTHHTTHAGVKEKKRELIRIYTTLGMQEPHEFVDRIIFKIDLLFYKEKAVTKQALLEIIYAGCPAHPLEATYNAWRDAEIKSQQLCKKIDCPSHPLEATYYVWRDAGEKGQQLCKKIDEIHKWSYGVDATCIEVEIFILDSLCRICDIYTTIQLIKPITFGQDFNEQISDEQLSEEEDSAPGNHYIKKYICSGDDEVEEMTAHEDDSSNDYESSIENCYHDDLYNSCDDNDLEYPESSSNFQDSLEPETSLSHKNLPNVHAHIDMDYYENEHSLWKDYAQRKRSKKFWSSSNK